MVACLPMLACLPTVYLPILTLTLNLVNLALTLIAASKIKVRVGVIYTYIKECSLELVQVTARFKEGYCQCEGRAIGIETGWACAGSMFRIG